LKTRHIFKKNRDFKKKMNLKINGKKKGMVRVMCCSSLRTMGAHLAGSTAKDTGHVRATVFRARVTSSKQLATVRLLRLFPTIGEGRISLMAEVEKRNCPRGKAARHCTERADTPYLGRLVLLFGLRTTMLSLCEQMYTMVLRCDLGDADRRERLKALRRGATHRCMQQTCTPYLGLRVLGRGHAHQCHTAG